MCGREEVSRWEYAVRWCAAVVTIQKHNSFLNDVDVYDVAANCLDLPRGCARHTLWCAVVQQSKRAAAGTGVKWRQARGMQGAFAFVHQYSAPQLI